MRWLAGITLAAALVAQPLSPARAEGSLGLDEVLVAVKSEPKLVLEIGTELGKNNLRAENVNCVAARHGNQWKYLGGSRAAPYTCEIGPRTLTIEADRVYFDPRGKLFGDLDRADPKQAKTFKESNFRWTWDPK